MYYNQLIFFFLHLKTTVAETELGLGYSQGECFHLIYCSDKIASSVRFFFLSAVWPTGLRQNTCACMLRTKYYLGKRSYPPVPAGGSAKGWRKANRNNVVNQRFYLHVNTAERVGAARPAGGVRPAPTKAARGSDDFLLI